MARNDERRSTDSARRLGHDDSRKSTSRDRYDNHKGSLDSDYTNRQSSSSRRPPPSDYYTGHSQRPSTSQRSRSPLPPYSSTSHRSRSPLPSTSRSKASAEKNTTPSEAKDRRNRAVRTALSAGAIEAYRQRKREGDWVGGKGMRVVAAAVSAGMLEHAADKRRAASKTNAPRRDRRIQMVEGTMRNWLIHRIVHSKK